MKALLLPIVLSCFLSPVFATAEHDYKPGEYLLIEKGLSPDKQYGLYAGQAGETFHIFLFSVEGKNKKKIGPLTEIEFRLDSAPEAFHAEWSPDSKHVAVTYRGDRHLMVMVVYRIENQRAYHVEIPSLFDTALPKFDREHYEMTDTSRGDVGLKWKGAKQFVLLETSHYWHVHKNPQKKMGKFGKVKSEGDAEDKSALGVEFSAEALCELTENDGVKILELKPGKFGEE